MKKNEYLRLHSEVYLTKGKNKSVLVDFNRKRIEYIPNDMYTIINSIIDSNKSIYEFLLYYNSSDCEIIKEYIEYVIDNEFGFITKTPKLFPVEKGLICTNLDITNAIVDIEKMESYNIFDTFDQILELKCPHLEIRFYSPIKMSEIKRVIEYFDNTLLRSLHILIQFNNDVNEISVTKLIESTQKLCSVIISNSPKKSIVEKEYYYIEWTSQPILDETHCGFVHQSYFSMTQKSYLINQEYNSCLYGKISVDKKGMIKNCPSMKSNFGSIKNRNLKEIVENDKLFKKVWYLKKDLINICKSCELRYICSDCRVYLENPNDVYSKPLNCNYVP